MINNTATELPLIIRVKDPWDGLYYRYQIRDGGTVVWESYYIKKSDSAQIRSSFSNANSYNLATSTAFELLADTFDNSSGNDSVERAKPSSVTVYFNL